MKIFMFDPDTDAKAERIMSIIKLRKNGEAAQLMQSSGNIYQLSYGVSIQHLKQIAKEFAYDSKLAEQLWYREVRETMLIATMISNLDYFTVNQCIEWSKLIKATELAEHFSMNLVSKMADVQLVIPMLLAETAEMQKVVAMFGLGWALKNNKFIAGELTQQIINAAMVNFDVKSLPYYRGLSFALRQLIRNSDTGKQQVQSWLQNQSSKNSHGMNLVIEEVSSELIWLENK